ncbi:hypothetical protein ACJOT3_34300, partial [Nocardiopsis sp. frass1]
MRDEMHSDRRSPEETPAPEAATTPGETPATGAAEVTETTGTAGATGATGATGAIEVTEVTTGPAAENTPAPTGTPTA